MEGCEGSFMLDQFGYQVIFGLLIRLYAQAVDKL